MANVKTDRKPLFGNSRSHALNATRKKQGLNTQKVTVNGKIARASYDVKIGDIVEITLGEKTVKFKVAEVKEVIRKEDACTMYEYID